MDLNVWIILALMVAVAGVTMISGLLIIILERTRMIGVLKALGARNKTIRHIFLWFATFIIGRGLVIGNIIGLGLTALRGIPDSCVWTHRLTMSVRSPWSSTGL